MISDGSVKSMTNHRLGRVTSKHIALDNRNQVASILWITYNCSQGTFVTLQKQPHSAVCNTSWETVKLAAFLKPFSNSNTDLPCHLVDNLFGCIPLSPLGLEKTSRIFFQRSISCRLHSYRLSPSGDQHLYGLVLASRAMSKDEYMLYFCFEKLLHG